MLNFVDTHCHIHESSYEHPKSEVLKRSVEAGVTRLICVGTDVNTSKEAVEFASITESVWASIGLHPHDAKLGQDTFNDLATILPNKSIVAIGECGLDYFYNYSDKNDQFEALEFQMQLASDNNLPMIFHVRDAFSDFWPIFDNFKGIKGVIHSFTATTKELDQILNRDLFVGLNGIMTFTKDQAQLEAARNVPLSKLLLETDAPFLTPVPFRGKINEPKNISVIAEFLSNLRGEDLHSLSSATTKNAIELFNIT
jgi:TatD DNase family protein